MLPSLVCVCVCGFVRPKTSRHKADKLHNGTAAATEFIISQCVATFAGGSNRQFNYSKYGDIL